MDEGSIVRRKHRRTAWAVGAVTLVALVGSPAGSADGDGKPYSASIGPAAAAGGSPTTFSVTILNQASPQHLGSVNLTSPPGFTITAAALAGPGTIKAPVGPALVMLRELDLAPGASVTVAVTATVPCEPGTYRWGITAKQSNDYNGPPGNDFTTTSVVTTTVAGCRLVFVDEPADAEVGAVTTAAVFDPAGPPITVAAVDGDGELVTSATGDVTVTLAPSPGALSGTQRQPLVDGVATFGDLSVGVTGRAFELTAAASGYTPATSAPFAVVTEGVLCSGGQPCAGSVATPTTTSSISASGLAGGTTALGLTVLDTAAFPTGVCGVFTALGTGVTVSVRPLPGLTEITMRLDKAVVNAKPTPNGVSSFDLCIGSDRPFPTKSGSPNVVDGDLYWGLLPDCPKRIASPCELSGRKDRSGDVILVGAVPEPWDPDVWIG
jgi:hypothetical protein